MYQSAGFGLTGGGTMSTILLTDANISFLVRLKAALEETGEFRVTLAANLSAAEEALRAGQVDAAVIDFELPQASVAEAVRKLRAHQPTLPILVTLSDETQFDEISALPIQDVLRKPYSARDLIPRLRNMLQRNATPPPPSDEFAPPQMPPELRGLVNDRPAAQPSSPTELLDEVEREKLDNILEELEAWEQTQTPPVPQSDEHETALLGWQEPPETRKLAETDVLDETEQVRREEKRHRATRPLSPRDDEPPRAPDDTPPVPLQDLEGVRQFLATDPTAHQEGFGEVLDAVAQAPPEDKPRSPRDQEFHELVDSMRLPQEQTARRRRLEDLLASIAADIQPPTEEPPLTPDDTLGYVLEALRQGTSPHADETLTTDDALEDTTIGEAIEDLFDPSFQGVLAALAGEEIDEEAFEEPTYDTGPVRRTSAPPPDEDRITPEAMHPDDAPAWMQAADDEQAEGVPLPTAETEPPPDGEAEGELSPATAALSAVNAEDEEFSLDALLRQIEEQLPLAQAHRPKLKPLPSWQREGELTGTDDMQALFDRAEGVRRDEHIHEPPLYEGDTRPSAAVRAELAEQAPQSGDTVPVAVPDEGLIPLPEAPAPPTDDLTEVDEDAIAEAFYEGVRTQAPPPPTLPEEVPPPLPPDDEHLIPMPVEEATQRIEAAVAAEEAQEEETEAAQIAVQLTQYALESSAQATILARDDELIASAGHLDEAAVQALFAEAAHAWAHSDLESGALMRYVALPEVGEVLLYSLRVEEGFTLSMAFHRDTALSAIRRQARRLQEALALVPEAPAARTQPSRPTALKPPSGLREAVATQTAPSPPPAEEAAPLVGYTVLLLPDDPRVELRDELAEALRAWLPEIAEAEGWRADDVDVQADYVVLTLGVPEDLSPDAAITQIMERSTERVRAAWPELGEAPLWADGYYVVTPPRPLGEREIARVLTVQRNAQE